MKTAHNYTHAQHNNIQVSDRLLIWQKSPKIIMKLDNSCRLVMLLLSGCQSSQHSSRVCGDAGGRRPLALPVVQTIRHAIMYRYLILYNDSHVTSLCVYYILSSFESVLLLFIKKKFSVKQYVVLHHQQLHTSYFLIN